MLFSSYWKSKKRAKTRPQHLWSQIKPPHRSLIQRPFFLLYSPSLSFYSWEALVNLYKWTCYKTPSLPLKKVKKQILKKTGLQDHIRLTPQQLTQTLKWLHNDPAEVCYFKVEVQSIKSLTAWTDVALQPHLWHHQLPIKSCLHGSLLVWRQQFEFENIFVLTFHTGILKWVLMLIISVVFLCI